MLAIAVHVANRDSERLTLIPPNAVANVYECRHTSPAPAHTLSKLASDEAAAKCHKLSDLKASIGSHLDPSGMIESLRSQ